ncbi:hypothetical protein JNK13_01785 [bacterium]|nr:hypothetical protein [bacterium]
MVSITPRLLTLGEQNPLKPGLDVKISPLGAALVSLHRPGFGDPVIQPGNAFEFDPTARNAGAHFCCEFFGRQEGGVLPAPDGTDYRLSHGDVHALHGSAIDYEWEIVSQTPSVVQMRHEMRETAHYPFRAVYTVTYEVRGHFLYATLEIENIGNELGWYAPAWHPSFSRGGIDLRIKSQYRPEIRMPLTGVYGYEGSIPLSKRLAQAIENPVTWFPHFAEVGTLDHSFNVDLTKKPVVVDYCTFSVLMKAWVGLVGPGQKLDSAKRRPVPVAHVYNGDPQRIAVELCTGPANAFWLNRHFGDELVGGPWAVPPGDRLVLFVRMEVGRGK